MGKFSFGCFGVSSTWSGIWQPGKKMTVKISKLCDDCRMKLIGCHSRMSEDCFEHSLFGCVLRCLQCMLQCVAVCRCVLLLCCNVLQCDRRPLKTLIPPKGSATALSFAFVCVVLAS